MDALDVLREMHSDAKSTFQRIEEANPDQRGPLWAKLRPELLAHEQIEKQFVYEPLAEDAAGRDPALARWDERHQDKVRLTESLMEEAGRLEPREEQWLSKLRELRGTLEQHIQEEETEIWPRIQQFWGQDKLDEIAGRVQAAKTAAAVGGLASGLLGSVGEIFKGPTDQATG